MVETIITQNEERDLRPENPYTKSFYLSAKVQAKQYLDGLRELGCTGEQIVKIIILDGETVGLKERPREEGRNPFADNEVAMRHAKDWRLECHAAIGDLLGIESGVGLTLDAPRHKYKPPKSSGY